MSSTNKTEMGFNQWILADKPTMEDFNADNILEEQLLGERYTKEETNEKLEEVNNSLLEKLDKSIISTGSWTPFFYGSKTAGDPTYTARDGFYCKIGPLVVGKGSIIMSSKGGMSGALQIGGLPFASARSFAQPFAAVQNINLESGRIVTGATIAANTMAIIWTSNTASGMLQVSQIDDNFSYTNFSIVYMTNL